jgi:hypothetical protein
MQRRRGNVVAQKALQMLCVVDLLEAANSIGNTFTLRAAESFPTGILQPTHAREQESE